MERELSLPKSAQLARMFFCLSICILLFTFCKLFIIVHFHYPTHFPSSLSLSPHRGTGTINAKKNFKIQIPKGVSNGHGLRLTNQGDAGRQVGRGEGVKRRTKGYLLIDYFLFF